MKGFFYFPVNMQKTDNQGVVKKCDAIVAAFRHYGCEIDAFMLSDSGIVKNGELWRVLNTKVQSNKYFFYLFFYRLIFKELIIKNEFKDYDFVYIRFTFLTFPFICFLDKIKQKNPAIRIIIEFPSFPYWTEAKDLPRKIIFGLDFFWQKKFSKLVDKTVTFTEHSEIFNIPTFAIGNGVAVEKIPFSEGFIPSYRGKLNLVAVGNLSFWHGYDRLLRGLAKFHSPQNIELKIIGTGSQLTHYQELTKKLSIESSVIFCGALHGKDLENAVSRAHLAVGSLAIHRNGLSQAAPLKHREYCAQGIPFILAGKDVDFQTDTPFVLHFPPDESDIEVQQVVDFYENLLQIQPNYRKKMRLFAEENLDWSVKLKPIWDWLQV